MRLTRQEYEELKRRHPELCPDLGAVATTQREPDTPNALVKGPSPQSRRGKRVDVVVTIVTFRQRLLDDDNSIGSVKPLRDAIAATIGIDDGDKRIRFQYGQVQTNGEPGCLVRIERVK